MSTAFLLRPGELNLEEIRSCLYQSKTCQLAPEAYQAMAASEETVQSVLKAKKTVYGINTGFGSLANQTITEDRLMDLQRNIVLSHACGTGELLDDETVKLILLLKINGLARGYSGIRPCLIEHLLQLYNQQAYPCIPAKGSVGASGDLVPLAHLSLPLIGEGELRIDGKPRPAKEGLRQLGIEPLQLIAKEGLALLNGLQVSAAITLSALFKAERLLEAALIAGALSVDAAKGSDLPFDERIHAVRGYPAQIQVADCYRQLLKGSAIRESHRNCERVQDPYSLRCQPQIMGAVLHQMQFVAKTLEIEANAVSDNPLVFAEQDEVISGGNFHGEIIAMAADNLALSLAEMGANSERRIALLIDKHFSGLPAFLVAEPGVNSGFMIAHVTAAAAASDNKALAHPHSVDSLPTSANQEDHVSMATNAARRLHQMADNTATIIAIELLAACQGLEFHRPLTSSPCLEKVYGQIRSKVSAYNQDRYFAPDLAAVKEMVLKGEINLHELGLAINLIF